MSTSHRPPNRPSWWPENEPWPPTRSPRWGDWRRNRQRPRHFFWRFGCALVLFLLLVYGSCTLFAWLVMSTLNAINSPGSSSPLPFVFLFALLMLGGAALFFTARMLRRTTQPVEEMMEAADHVAQGDYTMRVTERGPRDVRHLVRAFNSMSERLQLNDEQRRRLLADISHELRTPLTVLQGNLEGMLDGIYQPEATRFESLLEESRVMSRLID